MRPLAPAVLLVLVSLGCGQQAELDPEQRAAALARAKGAARRFGSELKAELVRAMGAGGPVRAIGVCSERAPAIAAQVEGDTGVKVGRSSLRLRSERDQGPRWVRAWLDAQGERPAAGVEGVARVEDGHARVLRPIAIEAVCLTCHGAPESIAPEVRSALAARYPEDRATGYRVGDLRGALWAEGPVP